MTSTSHRSRLGALVLDSRDDGAAFWSAALGMSPIPPPPGADAGGFGKLDASARGLAIYTQRVAHEPRVHLDIEATDIEAEVTRLEALGARRIAFVKKWWVMEAPTGHRFCVVPAKTADGAGWTEWPTP